MPWKPGESGNPSGRPRDTVRVGELARSYAVEAIDTLVAIMRHSPETRDQLSAAQALLDRGYGKPMQAVEHSGPEGSAIPLGLDLSALSPDQRIQLLELTKLAQGKREEKVS